MIIGPLEILLRTVAYMSWDHPFDPVSFAVTGLVIVGSSFLVALKSTSSIKSLDPVQALRFGLKSHSFRRNVVPLETAGGPLVWLMALKSSFASKKQNILVFVVKPTDVISHFFDFHSLLGGNTHLRYDKRVIFENFHALKPLIPCISGF